MLPTPMPRRKKNRPPAYPPTPHPGGQARIAIDGKSIYLGQHSSAESHKRYAEILAQWAAGRTDWSQNPPASFTVAELCCRYLKHAQEWYTKNGARTTRYDTIKSALRPLIKMFASEQAARFGPKKLAQYRDELIRLGLSDETVTTYFKIVRKIWKWAVAEELVGETIYRALTTVPIAAARLGAKRRPKVKPVSWEIVLATLPRLASAYQAMIWMQRLSGCRPGEARLLKNDEVERSGDVWIYRPSDWKTMHHENLQPREILIGPKLQKILMPYLDNCKPGMYAFRPAEHSGPGKRGGVSSRACYAKDSYRHAIYDA